MARVSQFLRLLLVVAHLCAGPPAWGDEIDEVVATLQNYTRDFSPAFADAVRKHFKFRKQADLTEAIQFLEARLGKTATLRIIQESLPAFSKFRRGPAEEFVQVYSPYLTPAQIDQRLATSLDGFRSGFPEDTAEVLKILTSDENGPPLLTPAEVSARLQKNMQAVMRIHPKPLRDLLNILTVPTDESPQPYLTREDVSSILRRSMVGFGVRDVDRFKKSLEVLGEYLSKDEIRQRMLVGFGGFERMEPHKFRRTVRALGTYLTPEQIRSALLRDLMGVASLDEIKVIERVALLKPYLTPEELAERIASDLKGFNDLDPVKTKANLEYLMVPSFTHKAYLTRDQVKALMKSNLQGLANIDLEQLKGVLSVLEKYLTPEEIRARMAKDLFGFAHANGKDLRAVLELVLNTKNHPTRPRLSLAQVKSLLARDLRGFGLTTHDKLEGVFDFLGEPRGTPPMPLLTKEELESLLVGYTQTFGVADRKNLEATYRALAPHLSDEQMRELFRKHFYDVASHRPEKLLAVLRKLETLSPGDAVLKQFIVENGVKLFRAPELKVNGAKTFEQAVAVIATPNVPAEVQALNHRRARHLREFLQKHPDSGLDREQLEALYKTLSAYLEPAEIQQLFKRAPDALQSYSPEDLAKQLAHFTARLNPAEVRQLLARHGDKILRMKDFDVSALGNYRDLEGVISVFTRVGASEAHLKLAPPESQRLEMARQLLAEPLSPMTTAYSILHSQDCARALAEIEHRRIFDSPSSP